MNPNAKEFVPAHIVKKRQEEEAAGDLARQLDKVELNDVDRRSSPTSAEQNKSASTKADQLRQDGADENNKSNGPTANDVQTQKSASNKANPEDKSDRANEANDKATNQQESNNGPVMHKESAHSNNTTANNHLNHNNIDGEYNGSATNDLGYGDDDRYLLNPGENLCEFNGEQFIIPGEDDEDYENHMPSASGYDFGNEEDNADPDLQDAFEQFLSTLPPEKNE